MVTEIAALDLWTLFIVYVFGNLWIGILGITILLFIILGVLGRISIYSTMWYCIMFFYAMSLGAGYVLINIVMTLALLTALYFSAMSYISSKS